MMGKPFLRPIFDFSLNVRILENEQCWKGLLLGVPKWLQDDVVLRCMELKERVFCNHCRSQPVLRVHYFPEPFSL